jgi:superfamily II DNA or RNA helicase
MDLPLKKYFNANYLQRGRSYVRSNLVKSVDLLPDGRLEGRVSNGRGNIYSQMITLEGGSVRSICSCPVGYNCKHVAAVLIHWQQTQENSQIRTPPTSKTNLSSVPSPAPKSLAVPVQNWLRAVNQHSAAPPKVDDRSDNYPTTVKDRLLYILTPDQPEFKVDIFKGRINAAGTGLTASRRRYDPMRALSDLSPPQFIRRIDIDLISALAKAKLWETHYSYNLPNLFRPVGQSALALIEHLCSTGRLLVTQDADTSLNWSEQTPEIQLAWHMHSTGSQRLGFETLSGDKVELRALEGATLWIDTVKGQIGALSEPIPLEVLRVVKSAPYVSPSDAAALALELPQTIASLNLPKPHIARQLRRQAESRVARLTLGAGGAQEGGYYWLPEVTMPAISLRFFYDGHEVDKTDQEPQFLEGAAVITLSRDKEWEAACRERLSAAGALALEHMKIFRPMKSLSQYDYVFSPEERNIDEEDTLIEQDILDFAFRTVPQLRRDGWEIIETASWPYRLSQESATISVATQREAGAAFQGNDWFSLGFQVELGGRNIDVAPVIAAFLTQIRASWTAVPDLDTLTSYLEDQPVYLDRGKAGYVLLNLAPLAPLLHLVLNNFAELGALHPSDAEVARLAEEALAGSSVRFSDKAGILPLARSLKALADAETFSPPKGLNAELRPYQAYGAAWMGSLLEAGFGAVLADDMGLGKTIQVLALLQARREAGETGPALLIVPTTLLHSWQTQAAQFTPELRVTILHGSNRAQMRVDALGADLVVSTYPLMVRDIDWFADREWPVVILDEAQTLKNPASQMAKCLRKIPAKGRLGLTGTPLENSLQDLWTLTDWINPGLLGDRKSFQKTFRTAIEKQGDRAAQARLNRRLRPFMLRRTKESVASELPPKTEILERVELPKQQQALYESVRSIMDKRVREAISSRGLAASRITVLDALLKLRQVCCDPSLIKTNTAASVAESAKRARVRALLAELVAEGRRVLVFSQFVEMLQLIENDLTDAGIAYLKLTGQTQNRADVLEAFAQGKAPVFLLSLKAGGVGLTLTEADTVILYDPWWNPAVERQAMDRTHRIGQDKPVFVHRLVAVGTVEEKILDMQARKQALADALFSDELSDSGPLLDEATIQDLFAPITI